MTAPGWYPDPAGAPGRFRYWDGRQWSAQTSDRPGTEGPGRPRRRVGPLLVAAAVIAVLALIVVFAVRALVSDPVRTADPGPLPSSTLSGGDDRSPTAAPSSPTPTPSPTPSPTTSPSSADEPCPTGEPAARNTHPSDGRIYGGGLSMPSRAGWSSNGMDGLTWAYDVAGQSRSMEQFWISVQALGALSVADGFDEPRTSAERVVQCTITSGYYTDVTSRKDLFSRAVQVDGRPGWAIRTQIRVDDPRVEAEGDVLEVIVVDTDQPESLSMFLGASVIGDDNNIAELDATIEKLRVE